MRKRKRNKEQRTTSFNFDLEFHQRLEQAAYEHKTFMYIIIQTAVNEYLDKLESRI